MATIASLEVEQIKLHLIAGGFLTLFNDIFGNPQPAPTVQLNELDLKPAVVKNNERVVMIRTTGGITNSATRTLYKERSMMVLVVGKVGESDSVIADGLARDMEEYLMANPSDGECMFNIVSSGVTGPMGTEDNRRAYEINFVASFNIVRPIFA